jgi:hypothetical protein
VKSICYDGLTRTRCAALAHDIADQTRQGLSRNENWTVALSRFSLAVLEAKNQHEQTLRKAEQGWLGSLLGSHGEKAGNISFIVILICFALIALAFYKMDMKSEFDSFMKFAGAMFAIITGALGYLFGASGGKSDK